jgi:hypothetical protein
MMSHLELVSFGLAWVADVFILFHLFVFREYQALRKAIQCIRPQFPACFLFLREHVKYHVVTAASMGMTVETLQLFEAAGGM